MKSTISLVLSLVLSFSQLTAWAGPVSPMRDNVPLPDELTNAITSAEGDYIEGKATIHFHINAAHRMVLESVDAPSQELKEHIWFTVHGMETSDTTLTAGISYTLTLNIVK